MCRRSGAVEIRRHSGWWPSLGTRARALRCQLWQLPRPWLSSRRILSAPYPDPPVVRRRIRARVGFSFGSGTIL